MAFGIQSTGFVAKRLDDIKSEIEQELRDALGNSINLLPESVLGQIVGIVSEREALLWELAEDVYNSQYPDTAFNAQLDLVCSIVGITRKAATKSLVEGQLFFGVVGTVIPTGTILSVVDAPSSRFVTQSPITLVAGVDEVQTATFAPNTLTAGSFKFSYKGEETATIAFNANAAAVQTALNNLDGLSGVTVSGSFAAGFTITFAGDDGKQDQPLLLVVDNTLVNGVTPSVVTVTETTQGVPQGIGDVIAESTGPTVAVAGTLTEIETPVGGFNRTINVSDAEVGRNIETDLELKARREEELQIAGAATPGAIQATVSAVEDVVAAIVFQNASSIVDGDGRPPHSVDIVVQGGDDAEIAEAIFNSVAAGIETIGDVIETVEDSNGFSHTVKFSRPDEVDIWIELDLTVDNNKFPVDGVAKVKNNIVTYGNSLEIGDDVIVIPDLIATLRGDVELGLDRIPGILDAVIRVGTASNPTLDANISIAAREIAVFDTARVDVTLL